MPDALLREPDFKFSEYMEWCKIADLKPATRNLTFLGGYIHRSILCIPLVIRSKVLEMADIPWTKEQMADELEFRGKMVNLRTAEAATLRDELDQATQELAELTAQLETLRAEGPLFKAGDEVVSGMGTRSTILDWHYCYNTSPDFTDWGGCGLPEDYFTAYSSSNIPNSVVTKQGEK